MVLPLLLAGAGYGLQAFGASQQQNAQDVADYKAGINTNMANVGREGDQRLTNSVLAGLGGQWNDSNNLAVNDLSAANQRGAFNTGSGQLATGIAGAAMAPTAVDPQIQAGADNVAFTRDLASRNSSNQIRTDALNKVLENNAGLGALDTSNAKGMAAQGDREMMIHNRIQDVLRLQNYANGIREAALARTGAQHALDSASAASTGSGAMYLGALLQAGSVLANRPGGTSTPNGHAGAQNWGPTGQQINGGYMGAINQATPSMQPQMVKPGQVGGGYFGALNLYNKG